MPRIDCQTRRRRDRPTRAGSRTPSTASFWPARGPSRCVRPRPGRPSGRRHRLGRAAVAHGWSLEHQCSPFGEIDGWSAAMAVTGANGMGGGGDAMAHGLLALHAARPGGWRSACVMPALADRSSAMVPPVDDRRSRHAARGPPETLRMRQPSATPPLVGRRRAAGGATPPSRTRRRRCRAADDSRRMSTPRRTGLTAARAAPPSAGAASSAPPPLTPRQRRARAPVREHAGADGGAGAELRSAGDEAVGDAGTEDAEAEQRKRREHERQA